MNTKTRTLMIIGIILLCAVGLIIALAKGNGGAPAAQTPATTAGTAAAPSTADQTAANAPGTVDAATQSTSGVAAGDTPSGAITATLSGPTPTPTATMTDKEEELLAEAQRDNPQSVTSLEQCDEVLKVEPWCSKIYSVRRITRPEWEQLLPKTEFYLGAYDRYGGEFVQRLGFLIIEQDNQHYTPGTYDLLLSANDIVITDENHELIAKAWALMTIPDYLGEEVVFTAWGPEKDPRYSSVEAYNLTGWARLGGVELSWSFAFAHKEYNLVTLGPDVLQVGIGDYIEIPNPEIPIPQQNAFYFFPVR